jgi:hypothetical protein
LNLKKPGNLRQTDEMREEQPRSRRGNRQITEKEADDVEEMSSPRTPVIYEVVRRLGDEEMDRPITSLWWSGVAAGLSISFSLLAEAVVPPGIIVEGSDHEPGLLRGVRDGGAFTAAALH